MSQSDEQKKREQRLAAKLRENLQRRKSQARARRESGDKLDAPSGSADTAPDGKGPVDAPGGLD